MKEIYKSKHNDLLSIWLEINTGRLFVWYSPDYGYTYTGNYATSLEPKFDSGKELREIRESR